MTSTVSSVLKRGLLAFTGPQLYGERRNRVTGFVNYNPGVVESIGDSGVYWTHWILSTARMFSPLIAAGLIRGAIPLNVVASGKILLSVLVLSATLYVLRFIGRINSGAYVAFLSHLSEALESSTPAVRHKMQLYDYDFSHHPVEYKWRDEFQGEVVKPRKSALGSLETSIPPCTVADTASWLMAKIVGIYMLYPGTIPFMYRMVKDNLEVGRRKMMEELGGSRFKLETRRGTLLDCMFLDRRNNVEATNASTLVVTCEGYSVLAWNHPGFGHSSGMPWPEEEQAAIDVVMQFALSRGFTEENIVILAWSIGAYPATWAAMHYPNIRGLFLDATFDDLLPLALTLFPAGFSGIVKRTVRNYMNLNIGDLLNCYGGPVTIVRRNRDEILSTNRDSVASQLASIRTNDLVISFLKHRYPLIFTEAFVDLLRSWLSMTPVDRLTNFPDLEASNEGFSAVDFSDATKMSNISDNAQMLRLRQVSSEFGTSSANRTLYCDKAYKQICSVRTNSDCLTVNVCSADSTECFEFSLPRNDIVCSMKVAPNGRAVAIQQSKTIIKFVCFDDPPSFFFFTDYCKSKQSPILGYEWLKSGDMLLIVSYCEVELYQFLPQRKCLKNVRTLRICTSAYIFSSEHSLIVTWSHGRSTPFVILGIEGSSLRRLGRFEVDHVCNESNVQPLLERQVIVVKLYGSLYVAVLLSDLSLPSHGSVQVHLYLVKSCRPNASAECRLSDVLLTDKAGKFAVHTVDDLLLLHQQQMQSTFVFDICVECFARKGKVRYHSPVFLSKLCNPTSVDQPLELYSSRWIFYQPDLIVDESHGRMWRVEFLFQRLCELIPSKANLVAFMINRSNATHEVTSLLETWWSRKQLKLTETRAVCDHLNSLIAKNEVSQKTILSQEELASKVFAPLSELQRAESDWLARVLLEYVRSLWSFNLSVEPVIWNLLVVSLARCGQFQLLQELLHHRVLPDLKALAFNLVSYSANNECCFQMALNMLTRRGDSADEVCELLMAQNNVLSALRYARNLGVLDKVLAVKLIEAASRSENPVLFFSVFQYFEKDVALFKQLQQYIPSDLASFQAKYDHLRGASK
uniref:AB hydrolase-1 domain-containing protein n=1 Tax=Trichuris muris TaxID=70415 RepID=A0A5S6QKG4_TRIMR